jgi:hypothetical protein
MSAGIACYPVIAFRNRRSQTAATMEGFYRSVFAGGDNPTGLSGAGENEAHSHSGLKVA